eukprot:TRINITY_DN3247_c0_g2_i5.p1 TRINITY_DN3247_c0_g2~~TRINITY_DN3247_c0_g2_i5.p1  ORF type:complete len:123 (+),score=17.94 TRINITY_DN3247_c0_g2_i5:175-543(+)
MCIRDSLMGLPHDDPARRVTHSHDFYSSGGLLDLVYHPCEHSFTLTEIGEMLELLDLDLIRFQSSMHGEKLYSQRFAGTPACSAAHELERWGLLERERPQLFSGLYIFWCQKRGAQETLGES